MKKRLLFLGPPGAGKGTQASRISTKYNLLHLSTGDLLRSEVKEGTELGKEAAILMDKGELVSDKLVLSIVEKKIISPNQGWLLDGFPRNLSQANSLESLLKKLSQPIELVLLLEVSDQLLIERLLARGRSDDNEETIANRLEIYREKTTPLIEHYSRLDLLHSINGDGGINQIEAAIEEILI